MLAILKYRDNANGGLFGLVNGDSSPLVDKILIETLPLSDFPYFDLATDAEEMLKKRVGEFAVRHSIASSARSFNNKTIYEFLSDTSDAFIYMVGMKVDETYLAGAFPPHKINALLNYHREGEYNTGYMVRTLDEDLITYLKSIGSDFEGLPTWLTFEAYMRLFHLAEFEVEFPPTTLDEHLGAVLFEDRAMFNGGAYRRAAASTNWGKVSRWETFQGIYKGLGFDWKIELNTDIQTFYDNATFDSATNVIPREQVKIRLFWQADIIESDPIRISTGKSHGENILPLKTKKYIMLRGRESVFDNDFLVNRRIVDTQTFTVVKGILGKANENLIANSGESFHGTSTGAWQYQFGLFAYTTDIIQDPSNVPEENYILYIDSFNGLINGIDPPFDFDQNGYLKDEVFEVDIPSYACPNHTIQFGDKAGQVYYWRFFTNLDGGNDNIAEFAMSNYARFLSGGNKRGKEITKRMPDVQGIDIYKRVVITDANGENDYYVSRINKLDYVNRVVSFEAIQL